MSSTEDILAKEIESWKGFEYASREENRILFNNMLTECIKSKYPVCVSAKGHNLFVNFNPRTAEKDQGIDSKVT